MFKRGLALSLVLCMGTFVQAGAIVELVPTGGAGGGPFAPCGGVGSSFGTGQVVTVEVLLSQDTVSDEHLRMVQLDFSTSDTALGLPAGMTWTAAVNHFAYTQDSGGANVRLSNTYFGDLTTPDLGLNTTDQFLLPGDGSAVKVGEFQVTMPGAPGSYTLDVLNSDDSGPDRGGQVRFGYGLGDPTSPLTTWRELDLTGGSFTFDVGGGGGGSTVTAADPDPNGATMKSLWRTQRNIVILTFDNAIVAPVAGEIEIRLMSAGGVLDPTDLSPSFTFTSPDPNTLVIQDTGANLAHRSWYSFENTGGWAGVSPFMLHYVVQAGDANGDSRVLFNDLAAINTSVTCFSGCIARHDINGDNRVLFNDLSAANLSVTSFPVAKPSGHDCP